MKFSMPAEWEEHERTWMAWPPNNYLLEGIANEAEQTRTAWAAVANEIARFEPVSVLATSDQLKIARAYLHPSIDIVEAELDDAWIRDSGPTFVKDEHENLIAVNWIFNGWGNQGWAKFHKDQLVASFVGGLIESEVIDSTLINEGGGIHVNGSGVVLLTETVQLGEGRNSSWSKLEVEEEIHKKLGTHKAIWIKRGLTRDYGQFGTRGHIDIVACFASQNVILYHDQQDPSHPDFEISKEVKKTLEEAGDFDLIALPAPKILKDSEGYVDYSYINHYIVNGAVILCSFDDPNDIVAKAILEKVYPSREIVLVDARPIFANGGGIHCITQQQPK
jgi:agmatine deiminase